MAGGRRGQHGVLMTGAGVIEMVKVPGEMGRMMMMMPQSSNQKCFFLLGGGG